MDVRDRSGIIQVVCEEGQDGCGSNRKGGEACVLNM